MPFRSIITLALALLLLSNVAAQDSGPIEDNIFGLVEGIWYPDLTCELGIGWERIIFDWSQHQPNGPDDWFTLNVDDRWLKAADLCDREVVAILKQTPAWATEGLAGVGVPTGLDLPLDHPDNYWANFVRRSVEYYASRGVNHFIIWNEPDIDAETYGYEFSGDMEDYFAMLKTAYLVAKETNPAAVIHLAGTTYWHDVNEGRQPYMTRLVERIQQDPDAAANDHYFDVLSLHIYFRTETVYDIVREMRQMLDENGLADKAIWINETNAAPTDDPNWPVERPVFNLDLTHQANFVVQSAVLALAAGAERIAVYKLYDQQLPPGGESFGLLNPADASPRPAFAAWRTVVEHFSDVVAADFAQTDGVELVRLQHHNGQQTLVAWARTERATQIMIEHEATKAYRLHLDGAITLERPIDRRYHLTLPPALCEDGEGCFLGGPVRMLTLPAGAMLITEIIENGDTISLNFVQE